MGAPPESVVYQQRETELALLKCIRGRMQAWQFTPASSDPIVIEQTYDFKAALAAGARPPEVAATGRRGRRSDTGRKEQVARKPAVAGAGPAPLG